ncbi:MULTISPECIES: hypothetical protein [Chromobacterium]|uniref:hypothetical protein n=2 Tax=Chromobacteriaceae TaxID=1499392 RepID=UPI000D4FDC4E|nr:MULTISPECIES: hypothetical protein [Chromobacterium]PTU65465.1 hypothetical protein DB032_11255 [Chromobacterium sp. Panama]UJB30451.1 hypothetical protein HQN78_04875 [Chromobacterium sp. Beijing]
MSRPRPPLLRLADQAAAPPPWPPGAPPLFAPEQLARARVEVSADYLSSLRRLSALLDAAFRAIVGRYFLDPRIRALYQLPKAMEALLRRAHGRPYRVGFYRPDFIYDRHGQPRICEVGARYPMNGWMISRWLGQPAGDDAFLQTLRQWHPPGCVVALTHAREPGTEIFLLAETLRRDGVHFLSARPEALSVRDGKLRLDGRTVNRCILEMDRSELPLLPDRVLDQLLDGGAYFNDIRTLILVHDKRVLAVLNREDIMRDCLDADDYAALRPFLIPSFAPASRDEAEALLARAGDFIAKPSSGGRGLGSLVRSACGETAWRELVLGQWPQYMFQDYIEQSEFVDPESRQRIRLVGMQLCRDAESYGPGVFRGSDELIINLHQRRGKLYSAAATA